MEVVFLSSDKDQEAFESYFSSDMPWLAVDFAQRELKEMLNMSLEVRGIPTLVWVNPRTGKSFSLYLLLFLLLAVTITIIMTYSKIVDAMFGCLIRFP